MDPTPSEPDPNSGGADEEARPEPVVDEGRFGIDLGPAGARTTSADPDETSTAPVRPPARTLTERLATAAADRDDASRVIDEDDSSKE